MAVELDPSIPHHFQSWSFKEAMIEAEQRSPSEASSSDFFDAEEKLKVTSTMEDITKTLEKRKSAPVINERYLSSEEALSPLEHNLSSDAEDEFDDDLGSIHEVDFSKPIRFGSCDMAIAVCIISVGRPRVINVEIPSPSSTSSSKFQRPYRSTSLQARDSASPTPPARKRPTPTLQTQLSPTPFAAPTTPTTISTPTPLTGTTTSHNSSSVYAYSPWAHSAHMSSMHSLSANNTPAFLSTDPFENANHAKRPSTPKHGGHSRLRNLSQKISRFTMNSATPAEPSSQEQSDQPAPPKQRKIQRKTSMHHSSPQHLSLINSLLEPQQKFTIERKMVPQKMVARGAAERAPPLELPPFPGDDDEMDSPNPFRGRPYVRRKSLLGF
jgi:hypothetical protein